MNISHKMSYIYKKHKSLFITLLIQISFVVLSFLFTLAYIRYNNINGIDNTNVFDIKYHLQQCEEIIADFRHGLLPSFNHFDGIQGLAESTFYPWLAFIPIILSLMLHIPLVIILKSFVVTIPYIIMNTIYYASKAYIKNKLSRWIIACNYLGIFIIIQDLTNSMDLSISLGLAAMVLSVFGYLYYIRDNKWKMLVCGMTLLCYTSLVLSTITIYTLIILALLDIRRIDSTKFKIGLKATLLTLMNTIALWLPLIVLMFSNKIYSPTTNIVLDNTSPVIFRFIKSTSFLEICCILISVFIWKHLSQESHHLILLSIIYNLLIIGFVPWQILQESPLALLQYIVRLGYVSNLMSIIAIIPYIIMIINKKHNILTMFIIMAVAMIYTLSIGTPVILSEEPERCPSSNIKNISLYLYIRKHQATHHITFNSFTKILNRGKVRQQYYLSEFLPQETLYLYGKLHPGSLVSESSTKSYIPNVIMQAVNQQHHIKVINNGVSIKTYKAQHNIRIPIIVYHGQKYHFYENGKAIKPIKYSDHEPIIKYIPKGQNKITFTTPYMWYRIMANIISISSIIIFAGYNFKNRKKHYYR